MAASGDDADEVGGAAVVADVGADDVVVLSLPGCALPSWPLVHAARNTHAAAMPTIRGALRERAGTALMSCKRTSSRLMTFTAYLPKCHFVPTQRLSQRRWNDWRRSGRNATSDRRVRR